MAENLPMKAQYIDDASKMIPDQQVLINMVAPELAEAI